MQKEPETRPESEMVSPVPRGDHERSSDPQAPRDRASEGRGEAPSLGPVAEFPGFVDTVPVAPPAWIKRLWLYASGVFLLLALEPAIMLAAALADGNRWMALGRSVEIVLSLILCAIAYRLVKRLLPSTVMSERDLAEIATIFDRKNS